MSAAEKILIAEETVAGHQSQLGTVETVLEMAEQVVATGEKSSRCLQRFFRVLLILSVVAAIAIVAKKVMGGKCATGEEPAPESETVPGETPNDDGGAVPDGDAAAS